MGYDIIGRDELLTGANYLVSGYGDVADVLSGYNIVGAQRMAMQRAAMHPAAHPGMHQAYAAAMQQAAAMKQAAAGAVITEQRPTRARRLVLPMSSSAAVAAAASATITARPQNQAFKPQRIVIPATIAPNFTIQDIKVGNISQLAQSGDLPAEAFVQTLFDGEMDMDTCQTSQDFVIQLTNISGAASTFRAAVYGRAVL
jgi:hypothetical protein